MNKSYIPHIVIVSLLILFGIGQPLFTVNERQYAIITELGKPKKVIHEPGLKVKVPFIQKVTYFDDRLLEYDADPREIITKDKKALVVDNYSRWKIVDPLRFLQAVHNERGAQARLDDIVYSELRVELGLHTLEEIVSTKRAELMRKVMERSSEKAREYGIEINDVRIKRADYPPENERAIYNRMRAERERIAKQYRAEGEREAAMIRAETDKERSFILADAYEKEQTTKGQGDATAVKIYSDAYSKDEEFYAFLRSLEAYKISLADKATLIISSESDFLRYLYGEQEQ
jgi:membrane protease subunit HflC